MNLSLEDLMVQTAGSVRPPERMTVPEAAVNYRKLNNPGSFVGDWDNSITPYMVEPQEELTSLDYTGMIFVGPARTGKSDIFFNYLIHAAKTDPADMMLYHMTQATARDWSQTELARAIRHSPALGECIAPGRHNRNVHDILFSSGMRLQIKWPSITELSGKTIPRLWLMDYDRMDQDVDKEGNPYDLAKKRATTFRRFGMCVAESSPGFEVDDPKWLAPANAPHEAPPTKGILSLYNRGDRRRWQWRCPQCNDAFEADFKHLSYPDTADPMEAAEAAVLIDPSCGYPIEPKLKNELNRAGRWVKEGQLWLPDGSFSGRPRRSDIASFWLKGTAAAFQSWGGLVLNYLRAKKTYEDNGDEQPLKVTTNTDQGHPYVPQAVKSSRVPEELKDRALDWGGTADDPVVPPGVRFLIATVDVQARSFVVQVQGYGPGGDVWLVDMFKIRKSNRLDIDGERLPVDPASYPEDWDLLIPNVIDRLYPLGDGSDRSMGIKRTGCDSGGREGVTTNAYAFWRSLRDDKERRERHRRFSLIKGNSAKGAPRVMTSYPDANRKDRHAGARGDVPVVLINPNLMKDQVSAKLGRKDQGADGVSLKVRGTVMFPTWAENWLYTQLTAEIRTDKGWTNPTQRRNEAWDLLVYSEALCLLPDIRIEQLDWEETPWAKDWDFNELVHGKGDSPFENHGKVDYPSLETLASTLA